MWLVFLNKSTYKLVLVGVLSLIISICDPIQLLMKSISQAEENRRTTDIPKPAFSEGNKGEEEFIIGPEDDLEIMVWKSPELTRRLLVRPDGKISFPFIGDVQAAGLTTTKLKEAITIRLKEYIAEPEVSVNVLAVNSYYFFMMGEIRSPGKYPLKGRVTLLQAITLAGGFTPFASKNRISVFRKEGQTEKKISIRFDDILFSENTEKNLVLRSGDTIVVP
ncbi:MAG: polysaccharide biosynthesis/export family protein [Nitrospirota bacterium]